MLSEKIKIKPVRLCANFEQLKRFSQFVFWTEIQLYIFSTNRQIHWRIRTIESTGKRFILLGNHKNLTWNEFIDIFMFTQSIQCNVTREKLEKNGENIPLKLLENIYVCEKTGTLWCLFILLALFMFFNLKWY